MNPSAFQPTPAGPLGGEFLVRACRNGGIGSDTIDQTDSQWVGYWHEAGGAIETVPCGASKIGEDGEMEKLSTDMRVFLGHLAGISPDNALSGTTSAQPSQSSSSGPISISMTGIQPIKFGAVNKGKKIEGEGFVDAPNVNLLDEEESDIVGKDTVLLSRGEH